MHIVVCTFVLYNHVWVVSIARFALKLPGKQWLFNPPTVRKTYLGRVFYYVFSRRDNNYKTTKIVRAFCLAERSVCIRVCKHGCGVKMFCFSRANHASTNLKKFSSSKLDKFTLFTHSFVGWNLENRYKEGVSIFFRLSWHFKREKSVFWKASFCKTRTDYACKTSCTRLCDW